MTHIVQVMTSADREATILSIDGIGVYDVVPMHVQRSDRYGQRRQIGAVHPFVLRVTINILWEDDVGTVHHVRQGFIDAFALQLGFASGCGLSEVTVGRRGKAFRLLG